MPNRYDPNLHHRRSVRLRGYNYAHAGMYFVTICAVQRMCWFGEIIDGEMQLNEDGQIVAQEWQRGAEVRSNVALDAFVVMPNHMHGLVVINEQASDTPTACPYKVDRQFGGSIAGSLSTIIGQFKSIVTKRINRRYNTQGMLIWQRNYYERIIRNERELEHVRQYIINNPARWEDDRLNDKQHKL